MAHLIENSYGKERVRLTKVARGGGRHEVHEYAVEVMLHGKFAEVYTDGNNAACIPTDTMKNSVYAVAKKTSFEAPEEFALAVVDHFRSRYEQVDGVDVGIAMERWRRIRVDGAPHPHAFVKEHGRRTAFVSHEGDAAARVRGGISGMEVFKSAGSGFSGFHQDELTTLPETDERILATTVDAVWSYRADGLSGAEYNSAFDEGERIIAEVFATHDSPSLQATLFRMGERMLEALPRIGSVRFSMPNQHHILFDLERFGMENDSEIFYGTDSPSGIITGTVTRGQEGER